MGQDTHEAAMPPQRAGAARLLSRFYREVDTLPGYLRRNVAPQDRQRVDDLFETSEQDGSDEDGAAPNPPASADCATAIGQLRRALVGSNENDHHFLAIRRPWEEHALGPPDGQTCDKSIADVS